MRKPVTPKVIEEFNKSLIYIDSKNLYEQNYLNMIRFCHSVNKFS